MADSVWRECFDSYAPSGLRLLRRMAGFGVERIWGRTAGAGGAGPSTSTSGRSWSS